jgi:hypothetical protein
LSTAHRAGLLNHRDAGNSSPENDPSFGQGQRVVDKAAEEEDHDHGHHHGHAH